MRDAKKKGNSPTTTTNVDQAANLAAKDPTSARLKGAGTVGNDAIQQRLAAGKANRDQLLQFLVQRLGTMRAVQLKEMNLLDEKHMAENKGAIADELKSDKTAPDPERWHEAAGLYEQAAIHLCRGALARGTDLMQQAVAAERRAFDSLTALVDVSSIEEQQGSVSPEDPPVSSDQLEVTATAATEVPEEVRLAKEIQDVVREDPDITWRKRTRDPWWTLDEEEEEEEEADGG
ncbi:MAG: hypothetical protein EP330_07535 [Deltaproteobacteria bacterium]|nr:MAG: hypothetical protein EP330_07535 [Deltaproteobacteria bacterium]